MCTENPARADAGLRVASSAPRHAALWPRAPPGPSWKRCRQVPEARSSKGLRRHRSPCRGAGREPACGSTPGPAGKGAQTGDRRGVNLADPLHGRLPPLPTGREGVAGRPVGSAGSGVPREQPCPGYTCGESKEVLLPTGLPPSLRLHHRRARGPPGRVGVPGQSCRNEHPAPQEGRGGRAVRQLQTLVQEGGGVRHRRAAKRSKTLQPGSASADEGHTGSSGGLGSSAQPESHSGGARGLPAQGNWLQVLPCPAQHLA